LIEILKKHEAWDNSLNQSLLPDQKGLLEKLKQLKLFTRDDFCYKDHIQHSPCLPCTGPEYNNVNEGVI